MRGRLWTLLPLLWLVAPACRAIEPYTCRNGFFPSAAGTVRDAVVRGAANGRSVLRGDGRGCPDDASCLGDTVPRGRHVLVATEVDGWSCVWYSRRRDESVGWMPTAELAPGARNSFAVADWVGRWEPVAGGGGRVDIARSGTAVGRLRVRSRANWVGGINGLGERVVHFGGFSGDGTPIADRMTVVDGECVVRMQRVFDSLVVADNASCGGVNVRFDDVYRRRR